MTKQELRQYRDLLKKIEKLEHEKAELLSHSNPPPDGQPRGGGTGDPTGSTASALADLTTRLAYTIEALYEQRYHIEKVISALPPREYNLMHSYYILGYTWEKVADEMGYAVQHIHRLHGSILQRLKKM